MALFLAKLGQDRLKKRLKKFRFEFCSYLNRARAFQKKKNCKIVQKLKKKKSFLLYFQPNQAKTGRKSDEKIFVLSFVPTRLGLEHPKKNSLKIKKHHSRFISSQIGQGQAKKEIKNFHSVFHSYPTLAMAFKIKQYKNSKNYKTSFQPNQARIGQEIDKKNFVPISVPTRPGLQHSQQNSITNQKIKKHHSRYISSQTSPEQAEKETEEFSFQVPFP